MNRQSISTGLGILSTVLITTVSTRYPQYSTIQYLLVLSTGGGSGIFGNTIYDIVSLCIPRVYSNTKNGNANAS